MPVLTGSVGSSGPEIVVRGSVVIELEWALATAGHEEYRLDHPILGAVYDAHPDLLRRVGELWGAEDALSCYCFLELMVLANHGGLLFTLDADALFDRFEELCRDVPSDVRNLPLLTETDHDRRAVYGRLEKLRSSPELRARYLEVIRDVWAAVRDDWEQWGRRSVEMAVSVRREAMARGADWHEVARHDDYDDLLGRTLAALGPEGRVAVVPAFFTHRGLIVDLPGFVVLGVRADTSAAEARARTEAVARRLKTISDPTRLAILDSLRSGPRTVTELASTFALAQPTVSNHVKLLRDAGLVSDERAGTRRKLVVQRDVVTELLASLQGLLCPAEGADDGAADHSMTAVH